MSKIWAREIDLPVSNYRRVVIYSPFMATKSQSVLHSIEDASNQLLKSSGYGIVAIDISDILRTKEDEEKIQKELSEVVNCLSERFESMPHVSAILFFFTQRIMKDEHIKLFTKILMCSNLLATHRLPPDMKEALKKGGEIGYKSLLDE
ncbi:MAG: hypothetical protein ABSA11_03355 [Candidatus Bathyarchaeia archaeon]